MTLDNYLVLAILIISVVLFVTEKLRVDLVALLILLTLIVTGLVTIEEAFQGFASPAVVTVWAVFIISGALQISGVADMMARAMLRLAGANETRLLVLIMTTVGIMSAFMNNIGAVAILMPAVISIGRKLRIPVSKLLIPLAFAALLGGNMTLIGTPPNILAGSIMTEYGVPAFEFFDFLPTGLLVLAAGMAYMLLFGRKLLPDRGGTDELADAYHVREYLTEVRIGNRSPLVGQPVSQVDLRQRHDVNIVYVRHSEEAHSVLETYPLQAGDVLLLEGAAQNIIDASRANRLHTVKDWSADQWHPDEDPDAFHLAEVTLAPSSRLAGQTLQELGFRQRYGLSVLAIRHNGRDRVTHLADEPLSFGDTLLMQGPTDNFNALTNDPNLLVLEPPRIELRRTRKAPIAVAVLLGVLVLAALGIGHVAALMLGGAVLMVLLGVLTMDEAYRAIDWKSVFLIACMLPLGVAMETTGTAQLLADQLVTWTGDWGPVAVLVCVFLLTALLTEVISNAAATVLVVPIAIDVAFGLNLDARPFVMATVLAASTSFLMPVGHQVNVLIFSAGNYRFTDYARVGIGLNLIILVITAVFVPLLWPFVP